MTNIQLYKLKENDPDKFYERINSNAPEDSVYLCVDKMEKDQKRKKKKRGDLLK